MLIMKKSLIQQLKEGYVVLETDAVKIPHFAKSKSERHRLIFDGKVQGVGFRLVVKTMAKRMHLTGWVKNLADQSVEVVIQGPQKCINFMENYLEHGVQRIKVASVKDDTLNLSNQEHDFQIVK